MYNTAHSVSHPAKAYVINTAEALSVKRREVERKAKRLAEKQTYLEI